jgi:hypothetical protein
MNRFQNYATTSPAWMKLGLVCAVVAGLLGAQSAAAQNYRSSYVNTYGGGWGAGPYTNALSRYGARGNSYGYSFYNAGYGNRPVDTSGAGSINTPHRAAWETYRAVKAQQRLAMAQTSAPLVCTGTRRDPLPCRTSTRRWIPGVTTPLGE